MIPTNQVCNSSNESEATISSGSLELACPRDEEELTELAEAASIGLASIEIAHDLGNCLNSMLLQASIIELQAPENLREKIAAIRSQGAQAAALLRPLQRVRISGREKRYPVDLNSIASQVFAQTKKGRDCVELHLCEGLPPLLSSRTQCLQLLTPVYDEFLRQALQMDCRLMMETIKTPSGGELALALGNQESMAPGELKRIDSPIDEFLVEMREIDRLAVLSLARHHEMEMSLYSNKQSYPKLILSWSSCT